MFCWPKVAWGDNSGIQLGVAGCLYGTQPTSNMRHADSKKKKPKFWSATKTDVDLCCTMFPLYQLIIKTTQTEGQECCLRFSLVLWAPAPAKTKSGPHYLQNLGMTRPPTPAFRHAAKNPSMYPLIKWRLRHWSKPSVLTWLWWRNLI